jgi:hypothetical protein
VLVRKLELLRDISQQGPSHQPRSCDRDLDLRFGHRGGGQGIGREGGSIGIQLWTAPAFPAGLGSGVGGDFVGIQMYVAGVRERGEE